MKKIFSILAFLPVFAFSSECEDMKSDLQLQAQSQKNALPSLLNDVIYTRSAVFSLNEKAQHFQALANSNSSDVDVYNAYNYAANSCRVSYESFSPYSDSLLQDYFTISNRIYALSSSIDAIDCLSCSADSPSTNCCDFTEILESLGNISNLIIVSNYNLSTITNQLNSISNSLEYVNFLLEHGFGDSTNLISQVNSLLTNAFSSLIGVNLELKPSSWPSATTNRRNVWLHNEKGVGNAFQLSSPTSSSLLNYGILYGYAQSLVNLQNVAVSAVNLQHFTLPATTNLLGQLNKTTGVLTQQVDVIIHESTNFFSFFRGEIGVKGVLSDWHSEQVSGSYHDFLTNHYLTVVRGGPLSGNQSSKTNWFSRIETLIAALVFTDSETTNTVDTSAGSRERADLQNSIVGVNQSASNFSQNFSDTSNSLIDLYRGFFQTFENATVPSNVILMSLGDGDSGGSQVGFESGAIMSLVEGGRAVTTFCWASVGIFLLYKFLVWSGRSIVVTCQFIYRVISSIFK